MVSQQNLVQRIASICTQVVPDHLGVHLRFINKEPSNANNLRLDHVKSIMSRIEAGGTTEIGTNLRKRILDPLVYQTKMTRPILVSIITDGIPGGAKGSPETKDTLRNEILKCQEFLLTNGLPPRGKITALPTCSNRQLTC